MDDKLKADIEAIVKSIFANREESAQKAALEETLEKSAKAIEDLTETLASKNTELEEAKTEAARISEELSEKATEYETTLEGKDVEISALTEKVEKVEEDLKAAVEAKDELTSELEGIKADQLAAARMEELAELKVARQETEAQEKKVRAQTDEEFEAYKEELVSIRESIVAELGTGAEGATSEENDDGVPPPDVDTENAEQAALNLENASNSVVDDYKALGSALAEMIKDNK